LSQPPERRVPGGAKAALKSSGQERTGGSLISISPRQFAAGADIDTFSLSSRYVAVPVSLTKEYMDHLMTKFLWKPA
jgi:hypothetical protein